MGFREASQGPGASNALLSLLARPGITLPSSVSEPEWGKSLTPVFPL